MPRYCISSADVIAASKRISSLIHQTPVLTCASLDFLSSTFTGQKDNGASRKEHLRRSLFFKNEAFQRSGSFKFRGALNAILSLVEERKGLRVHNAGDLSKLRVVTHSSGNHAAALALAGAVASRHSGIDIKTTAVMPRDAPKAKIDAVQCYGAEVILVDNIKATREREAQRIVEETGSVLIHPFDDHRVMAGQGTVGLEMIGQVRNILHSRKCADSGKRETSSECGSNNTEDLNCVIIPVGGGGLGCGCATILKDELGNNLKVRQYQLLNALFLRYSSVPYKDGLLMSFANMFALVRNFCDTVLVTPRLSMIW